MNEAIFLFKKCYSDGREKLLNFNLEVIFCKNGKTHRDNDLPAVISYDDTLEWFQNGNLHRDNDLPAVVWYDGRQDWFQNGKRHRDNGPAVIWQSGEKQWWKHGEYIKTG